MRYEKIQNVNSKRSNRIGKFCNMYINWTIADRFDRVVLLCSGYICHSSYSARLVSECISYFPYREVINNEINVNVVFFFFFLSFFSLFIRMLVDDEGRWGDIFRRRSVQAGSRGGCRLEGARGFDSIESLAQGKGRPAGPSVAKKQNINTSHPSSNDNQRRRDHHRLVLSFYVILSWIIP